MSQEAVHSSAVRTPIGRYNGVLKDVRPDDLGAFVIRSNQTAGIAPTEEMSSCLRQPAGEDNRNIARMALLLAGFLS